MPTLFGGFTDPTYISTDSNKDKTDTYIKSEPIPSRYLGQNFKVPRGKSGRTADTFFGAKFLTLASKEQNGNKDIDVYEDPGKGDRRAAAKSKTLRIDKDKDFKYVSYPKRSTGAGSIIGTFTPKNWEHMADYKVVARDQAPERPKPQPPGVYTKPSRKGTYGFPNTTLMPVAISPMLDKEKKPITDEFDAIRKRDKVLWEKSKKMCLGGVFKLSGTGKKTFDESQACGISTIYKQADIKEEKASKKKSKKKEAPPPKPVSDKPFKYSSPAKFGTAGYLGKYPNTRDDPKIPKEDPYDTVRLKKKEDAKKAPKALGGQWKPVSGSKSGVIRSLLKKYY